MSKSYKDYAGKERRPKWFRMYHEHSNLFLAVPVVSAGRLAQAIAAYFDDGTIPEGLEPNERVAFNKIAGEIDRSREDWEKEVDSGSKGGKAKAVNHAKRKQDLDSKEQLQESRMQPSVPPDLAEEAVKATTEAMPSDQAAETVKAAVAAVVEAMPKSAGSGVCSEAHDQEFEKHRDEKIKVWDRRLKEKESLGTL